MTYSNIIDHEPRRFGDIINSKRKLKQVSSFSIAIKSFY